MELEFPGSNVTFVLKPQWYTKDGKLASEAAAKVLTQLATGTAKQDLDFGDINSARRNLYAGAPGMTENKKHKRR
jgi:poly-D-alanine transfer protein DltD